MYIISDTEDYEFRLDSDSIEMWEHKNWNKVESQSAFWEPCKLIQIPKKIILC